MKRSLGVDTRSAELGHIQGQLTDMNVGLHAMIGSLRNELHRDIERVRDESDANRAHLELLITESVDVSVRHAAAHAQEVADLSADRLAARIARVERALRSASSPGSATPAPSPAPAIAVAVSGSDGQIEQPAAYAAFEEQFRGPSELVRQIQEPYIEDISTLPHPDLPVVDVGCGRGEFVKLLAESGISAYGVDLNQEFVTDATANGIDLRLEDAKEHLAGLADGSVRAITSFHVVEHLPFRELVSFLDEIYRVLMPEGLVLLETPNPENLAVGANRFWLDPTHIRPLPPMLLGFLVREAGFDPVEVRRLHPLPDVIDAGVANDEADAAIIAVLNDVLAGPIDYAVLGRRL